MNWSDFFKYENGKLIWKISNKVVKVGQIAGTLNPRGYVIVGLRGRKYSAHRVIWELVYGPIPLGMEIDHIDGCRSNNEVSNLRLVTPSGNNKNMAKRSDNTSGFTGVTFNKQHQKWKASAKENGKVIHLGFFENILDAAEARKSYQTQNGYSTRHGT